MKKTLSFLALAFLVALPLAAQPHMGGPNGGPPPGPGGPGGPGPDPVAVLKDFLGLSDAQLQQLKTLGDARNQAAQALQQQAMAAQQALGDALNAATPDPAAIGSALLAVRNVEKQFGDIQKAFKTGFEGLLTGDQKTKYASLAAFEATIHALDASHALGL